MKIRTGRTGAFVGAAAGAVALVGATASPAMADSSAYTAVGLPLGGGLSTYLSGSGQWQNSISFTRAAGGNICAYAGRVRGTLLGGAGFSQWTTGSGSGCSLGTAGQFKQLNRNFQDNTRIYGGWKENGAVAPNETSHCVKDSWNDFC